MENGSTYRPPQRILDHDEEPNVQLIKKMLAIEDSIIY
jgi:hypothetical protein